MDLFNNSSLSFFRLPHYSPNTKGSIGIFTDWLWSASFWLPQNWSWTEIHPDLPVKSAAAIAALAARKKDSITDVNDGSTITTMSSPSVDDSMVRPHALDLLMHSALLALGFVLLRQILERYVFDPLGRRAFGIVDRPPRRAAPNPMLEAHYNSSRTSRHPSGSQVTTLARKAGMTDREVEVWFRTKRGEKKPTKLTKFRESSWRLGLRSCLLVLDVVVLWNKSWLRKTELVFEDYPMAPLDADVRVLYIVQFAFYLSLLMTLFHDVRRSDFKEELLHHIVTLLLILLSWCLNQVRIGSLVMLLMEPCDVMLEIAKLASYISHQRFADGMFVIFTAAWVVTRIVLYLWIIMYNSLVMPLYWIPMFPGFIIFNALLGIIFLLQMYWFSLIVKVAVLALRSGKVEDVRSDDEEDTASTGSSDSGYTEKDGNGSNSNNKKASRNGSATARKNLAGSDGIVTQRKQTTTTTIDADGDRSNTHVPDGLTTNGSLYSNSDSVKNKMRAN